MRKFTLAIESLPSLVTTRVMYSLDLLLVPEVGLGVDALFIHSFCYLGRGWRKGQDCGGRWAIGEAVGSGPDRGPWCLLGGDG